VPAEERTEAQIRTEIAGEREQLVAAVAGLREGVKAKRQAAIGIAVAVPVAIGVALVAWRLARRHQP
jgi:hypothetical protein